MFSATITLASPEDSGAIARIMKIGASEQIRRITVIGSHGLQRYIEHQIRVADADQYLIGLRGEQIIGMTAWGHIDNTIMLNHIFLLPEFRGMGLGALLVCEGLRRLRRGHEQQVAVDVFAENARARSWYDSLGLHTDSEKTWVQIPLDSVSTFQGEGWTTINMAQADLDQTRFGFSRFQLRTLVQTYSMGRLGESLFRCPGFDILNDPCALGALATIDPTRALLCASPSENLTPGITVKGRIVARSERMSAPVGKVLDILSSRTRPIHNP